MLNIKTDISSIQNAYQGFAKGNYTMLDNLKLGYGGTKEEMKRLLSDAEKLTGKKFDLSNFADITEAIHAIQDQYGITGTTAKEAASTIQGSISAMKSSYQNLLAGLADENADLGQLVGNLMESVFTVADNVVPRIGAFLGNMSTIIKEKAPDLINQLVSGLTENLQPMLEAAVSILSSLVTALTDEKNITLLVNSAVGLVLSLANGLIDNIEPIINGTFTIISSLATSLLEDNNLQKIIDAAFSLITTLVDSLLEDDNLSKLIEAAITITTEITTGLIDHIPELIDAGLQLIGGLLKGLWDNRGKIFDAIKKIGASIISTIKDVLKIHSPSAVFSDVGKMLIQGLINGIDNAKQWVVDKIRGLGSSIIDTAKSILGIRSPSKRFYELGNFTGVGFGNGFTDSMKNVRQKMAEAIPTDMNTEIGVKLRNSVNDIRNFVGNQPAEMATAEKTGNSFAFNIDVHIDGNADKSNLTELAEAVAEKIYRATKSKMEVYA